MIVVDVETGGLDLRENPLLSIGAIDFDNPDNHFYGECSNFLGTEINEKALEVNGFTRKQIYDNPVDTKTLLEKFFEWVSQLKTDLTLAGENPSFDRDFINYYATKCGLKSPFGHRTVDMHSIAYADMIKNGKSIPRKDLTRQNALNADVIHVYCGIPAEPQPHNALNGAIWEAESFSRLIHNENMFLQFSEYPLDTYRK